MRYKTLLLFGAPGAGKGTQGMILGTIPGFYHCACGDVFRSLDLKTDLGQSFLEYSSRGELVPDELAIKLWNDNIGKMEQTGHFDPEVDFLVLDGIPRNVDQARIMESHIRVEYVFHLSCPNRESLVERLKRRALRANRYDDASEVVIRRRLETYDAETKPVLEYYGPERVHTVDATQVPHAVLRDIISILDPAKAVAPVV